MTLATKYPLGVQTFSEIRRDNYVYVDKTALIYDLIRSGQVYFLSRPRRFGKSLLISTFESLFGGDKPLFDGLAIADTDYDFIAYPVVKLEFSKDEFNHADDLRAYIVTALDDIAACYGIELKKEGYNYKLTELVVKLHEKYQQKVVFLVDEYDKPILNNLNKPALDEVKQVIGAFYATVKALDEHLRFVFITGVSKFAKDSVFSGMNSLTDISMAKDYSTLCGVTQQELEDYLADAITDLANAQQQDRAGMLAKIKHWYNGYYFHHMADSVYNPFSLLSLFKFKEFKNHWFATGTPTFLLDLLQTKQYDLKRLTEFPIGENAFEASDVQKMSVQSIFVQTGYLTIKSYESPLYTLDFPNNEVRTAFYDAVVAHYSHLDDGESQSYIVMLSKAILNDNLDDFFAKLAVFFANIPYDLSIDLEKYYQAIFYSVFTLLGFEIEAEVRTNKGRIDCVLHTDEHIYIIEFKLNDSSEAALTQVIDKQYAQKYLAKGKKLVLVGVAFDQQERNIADYVSKHL